MTLKYKNTVPFKLSWKNSFLSLYKNSCMSLQFPSQIFQRSKAWMTRQNFIPFLSVHGRKKGEVLASWRVSRFPNLVLIHNTFLKSFQVSQPSVVAKHILDELLPCLLLIAGRTLWQVALSPKWSGARRSNLSHSVCSRSNWSGERRRSFLDFSSKEKILWKGRKRRRSNLDKERMCQRGDFVTCLKTRWFAGTHI